MRRLAAALGVQNGATYWHFPQAGTPGNHGRHPAHRPDGRARRGSPWTSGSPSWHTGCAGRCCPPGRRTPVLCRFFPLPNALAYGEAMIAALGESGLSSRDAAWAADTLTYYIVGHTIEEQLAAALPGSGHDATARLTGAVDPQRHPHMHAALAHIPAPHHQEHFDYGLGLIVKGIRADTERP